MCWFLLIDLFPLVLVDAAVVSRIQINQLTQSRLRKIHENRQLQLIIQSLPAFT